MIVDEPNKRVGQEIAFAIKKNQEEVFTNDLYHQFIRDSWSMSALTFH